MLIEFSVKNFKSINQKQTLNLNASKSKELDDSNTFVAGGASTVKLLNSVAIYGANASGKTNLLKAFSLMKNMVIDSSSNQQRGDGISVMPFLLDKESRNAYSEFEVIFIVNKVKYQYGFSLNEHRISEEWLFAFPKGRIQEWFVREWKEDEQSYNWNFGPKLLGEKSLWLKSTRENALFLSTAVQLNSTQLQPIFDWFKKNCRVAGIDGWNDHFSIRMCKNEKKNEVLKFLKTADLGISDIKLTDIPISELNFPEEMSEKIKQDVISALKKRADGLINVDFLHENSNGQKMALNLHDESSGTNKLFAFAGPWIDCLENGYIVFIDELHQNLHPKLVNFLVSMFHDKKTNPKNAQLIFTTHETSILNSGILRRDQVWFCEKDENAASQYFSLSDFKVQKGRNIELGYLSGRYGAVPFIDNLMKNSL